MTSGLDVEELAEQHPLAHPAVTSIRLFDYPIAPGDHLLDVYNATWKACDPDFPYAPTRIARLLPRGHGKTEGVGVVIPTWLILKHPKIRIAVISKTKGLASERTEKVVDYVERYAPQFGIDIQDVSRTELTTAANADKEATISPYGLESQLTGKHFDVIIYDDIVDWDNQRTETQRRNVRNYFGDYVDNLGEKDSILPQGSVQVLIGTRKHPQDLYATDVLDDARWDTGVFTAIHEDDWGVVETRDWQIQGDDGEIYDSLAALPDDVAIAPNGVLPNRDVRVLWPDHQPAEALLYDVVNGGSSVAIWKRENQQDPNALSGQVFKPEWLQYVDGLPVDDEGEPRALRWVAGLDIGLVEDPQKAVEGDSDYTALSIIGVDYQAEQAYLDYVARERGMSVAGIVDWVEDQLNTAAVAPDGLDVLLVEQNAGRGPGQRLRDDTSIPAKNISSTGEKEQRLHNLAADFESGRLQIHGDPSESIWRAFEQDEWAQFPTAAHDDMMDSAELAMRTVGFGSVPTATADLGGSEYTADGEDVTHESREFKESAIGQAVQNFQDAQRGGFRR